MNIEYIIVQAGGKGSRLQKHTKNKPKALFSVDNLPIIFHLFKRFPEKKYIIISDYKHDVLIKYMEKFANVDYTVVKPKEKGTCSGIKEGLSNILEFSSFMLIWSDLILGDDYNLNNLENKNYIGISKDFECRWSYKDGTFKERKSFDDGVAGLFVFKDKKILEDLPKNGEFVRWLKGKNVDFNRIDLYGTKEYGDLESMKDLNSKLKCRPFNDVIIKGDRVIKKPLNIKGEDLAERERDWYKEVNKHNFISIPKIYSYNPLEMERIKGRPLYRSKLDDEDKIRVLDSIVEKLNKLHSIKKVEKDIDALRGTYYDKTIDRLESIKDLIPFSDDKKILINGKLCKNIYFYKKEFKKLVEELLYCTDFNFIHGDCTFSNILLDDRKDIYLIDPRGYFGEVKFYGDVYYDWSKLYYSMEGSYDNFNNKNFELFIKEDCVEVYIEKSGWEHLTEYFIEKAKIKNPERIKLIHSIIWLSLTTYVWDDYDSICGSFYKGLEYLEEFLK